MALPDVPKEICVNNLFVYKELLTYNNLFKKYVLFECQCYTDLYVNGGGGEGDASSGTGSSHNFEEYIFRQRNSYMACVAVNGTAASSSSDGASSTAAAPAPQRPIIKHLMLPIMLGSAVDLAIRRHCGLEQAHHALFGGFLIKGGLKIISNFITNNTRGGCVRINRKTKSMEYKMMVTSPVDHLTMKLSMDQAGTLSVEYEDEQERLKKMNELTLLSNGQRRKRKFVARSDYTHEGTVKPWIRHVHECSPLSLSPPSQKAAWDQSLVSEEDYVDLFHALMAHAPKLDDLGNKTIVSAAVTLHRAFMYVLEKMFSINAPTLTANKIRSIFQDGNMYMVLSSTSNKLSDNISAEYGRTVYQHMDAEKLDSIFIEMSVIRRYIRNSTKNSDALKYPIDGENFLCPVSIKEMVGAGETLYFSLFTICAPEIDAFTVMYQLSRIASRQRTTAKHRRVVVGCFLTHFYLDDAEMRKLKRVNTFLLFRDAGERYLTISHQGNTPVKYSPRYKLFLSPFEASSASGWYPNAFDDYALYAKLSAYGQKFSDHFARAPPQKLAVSVTNFRGSSALISSSLMAAAYIHHIGTNSALLHTEGDNPVKIQFFKEKPEFVYTTWDVNQYIGLAHLSSDGDNDDNGMPENLKRLFAGLSATSATPLCTGTEFYGTSLQDVAKFSHLDEGGFFNHILSLIHRVLPADVGSFRICDVENNRRSVSGPIVTRPLGHESSGLYQVSAPVPVQLKFDPSEKIANQFTLYTMYGDLGGGTNEDGLILDEKVALHGPRHMITSTSVVTFNEHSDDLRKTIDIAACALCYKAIDTVMGSLIIVGVLESRRKLIASHSKMVQVGASPVGSIFRYYIMVNDLSCHTKIVSSYLLRDSVHFMYRSIRNLGVGTKMANCHGQKGIVSSVRDLSHIVGYTRSGTRVHPQILYSITSLPGRSTVSQVQSMLTDPEVAFTPEGYFIGRLSHMVHNIDPGSKVRCTKLKNDLMTSENGYEANSMSCLAKVQAEQAEREHQRPHELNCQLQVVFNLFAMQGIRFEFMQQQLLTTCSDSNVADAGDCVPQSSISHENEQRMKSADDD